MIKLSLSDRSCMCCAVTSLGTKIKNGVGKVSQSLAHKISKVWRDNRVYQKSERLKNYSKLKSMKYLIKILFYLDKLVPCLPSVAKSLVCDSQE